MSDLDRLHDRTSRVTAKEILTAAALMVSGIREDAARARADTDRFLAEMQADDRMLDLDRLTDRWYCCSGWLPIYVSCIRCKTPAPRPRD